LVLQALVCYKWCRATESVMIAMVW